MQLLLQLSRTASWSRRRASSTASLVLWFQEEVQGDQLLWRECTPGSGSGVIFFDHFYFFVKQTNKLLLKTVAHSYLACVLRNLVKLPQNNSIWPCFQLNTDCVRNWKVSAQQLSAPSRPPPPTSPPEDPAAGTQGRPATTALKAYKGEAEDGL